MEREDRPHILSPSQRDLWSPTLPSIWTLESGQLNQDPARAILRTLFDQPRWLEAYLLYDELGSQLFEQICELPEYYLTRTENSILAGDAEKIIASAPVECIVELGAGSSRKTMHLLREQVRQREGGTFAPIDVSLEGLTLSRDTIRQQLPHINFNGLQARYEAGISGIEKSLPTLFVFLGSTVGNFNLSEFVRFFHHLSEAMGPKDYLLLGVDRVKEVEILEKAYNDAQGVTAAFILNVFSNINQHLKSDFDLKKMRYHSWYNSEWQQIEMYAISTSTHEIHFPSPGTSFMWPKEDRILVEISRKFEPARLQQQLQFFGLKPVGHFTDPKEWFSLLLFEKANT